MLPHLEFASPVWNPYLAQNINVLEAVQRCATRRIPSIRHLPYSERLAALGMDSLKLRRLATDLVNAHKVINHHNNSNLEHLFDLHVGMPTKSENSTAHVTFKNIFLRSELQRHGINCPRLL